MASNIINILLSFTYSLFYYVNLVRSMSIYLLLNIGIFLFFIINSFRHVFVYSLSELVVTVPFLALCCARVRYLEILILNSQKGFELSPNHLLFLIHNVPYRWVQYYHIHDMSQTGHHPAL